MEKDIDTSEVWRNIDGYEGFYKVSNLGRVQSLNRVVAHKDGAIHKYPSKIIRPYISKGYHYVQLHTKGSYVHKIVHRLVAEAFIPNPMNLPQVNHKDGNKANNYTSNLEWCTASENEKHAYREGLKRKPYWMSEKVGALSNRGMEVAHISKDGVLIRKYPTAREAAKVLSKHPTTISRSASKGRVLNDGSRFVWSKDLQS